MCLSCNGNPGTDLVGKNGERWYVYESDCYVDCPNKTAPDLSSRKCIGCSSNCNKCGTLEGPNCYECLPDWLLEDGVCVSECTKEGFHANRARTRCINETEFPTIGPVFSILSVMIVITVLIAKKLKKETSVIPTLVALISLVETASFFF
mmetsp:Transcript_21112/g.32732  ORF Transcript_21112/g.32732 Transcript_21112/m.32732 type:complete len:150 (+) Transcript_21112:1264-1713(+)